LIEKLGITKYKIMEADIDETMPASMPASEAVQMAALKKAQEVERRADDDCVHVVFQNVVQIGKDRKIFFFTFAGHTCLM